MMQTNDRTPFGKRLVEARELAGFSQIEAAKAIGMSQGTLAEAEVSGKRSGYTSQLAALYKVSPVWLATGKGTKEINSLGNELAGFQLVNPDRVHQVPVVGKGMGGFPDRMFTDEGRPTNGHDEYAEVMSADKSAFVARVDGDSMYPRFMNGDYALVEPATEPELEDDVLLKLSSGEVMLKRLLSRKNGILLGSYNEPQTYRYNEEEIVWMYYVAHPVPARKIKSRV